MPSSVGARSIAPGDAGRRKWRSYDGGFKNPAWQGRVEGKWVRLPMRNEEGGEA